MVISGLMASRRSSLRARSKDPLRVTFKSIRIDLQLHIGSFSWRSSRTSSRNRSSRPGWVTNGEILFGAGKMPMMITVAVVVAHHSAVISGTKSVINKSQVVLGDGAARVLPYLLRGRVLFREHNALGSFRLQPCVASGFSSPEDHSTDRASCALSVAQDSAFQHSSRKPEILHALMVGA